MYPLVAQRLADELADRSRSANLAQIGVAVLVAGTLWPLKPPGLIWWAGAIILLSAIRVIWLGRLPRPFPLKSLPLARMLASTTGLAWGIGIGSAMTTVGPESRAILVFVIAGLVAGACQSLYFDPPSLAGYCLPLVAGGVGVQIWISTYAALMTALMLTVFAAYMGLFTKSRYVSTKELIRSREVAVESMEVRRLFLANVSHEIRTPLNGIVGMTDLLLRTPLDADQIEYAVTTRTCAESLSHVIDDILDYSKIEAGRMRLRSEGFNLAETVEQAVEILAQRARESALSFSCYIDPRLPLALIGDADRLRQVLLNLANNALKFTREGAVSVEVSGRTLSDHELELKVSVRDTGIGIDPAEIPRLFEAFTQVDASGSRRHGGSGLGLAICRRLVEMMGGQIGVESVLGEGSCFWFTARIERQEKQQSLTELIPAPLEKEELLLVDPEPVSRGVLVRQLLDAGIHAQGIESLQQASALLESEAPPGNPHANGALLVLVHREESDTEQQILQGIEEKLLSSGRRALLIRPLGFRGDADRSRQAGYINYLSLPVKPSWLLKAVAATWKGMPFSPTPPDERSSRGAESQPANSSRGRLLLAEDNPVNRMVAVRMLEDLGYEIVTTENGVQAFEALGEQSFDMLLSDVQMPEMDGLELTRAIREGEKAGEHLPIIAMTAHAFAEDKQRCLDAGMDDYVRKPVDRAELDRVITRLLDSSRAGTVGQVCSARSN